MSKRDATGPLTYGVVSDWPGGRLTATPVVGVHEGGSLAGNESSRVDLP